MSRLVDDIVARAEEARRKRAEERERKACEEAVNIREFLVRSLAADPEAGRIFVGPFVPMTFSPSVLRRAMEILREEDGLVIERQESSWWRNREAGWWFSGWAAPAPGPEGPYR